jgi:hypothetical protein
LNLEEVLVLNHSLHLVLKAKVYWSLLNTLTQAIGDHLIKQLRILLNILG